MKQVLFRGSGVALVTPMNKDYSVDYGALRELLAWQLRNGTAAIIVGGTTGEAATLEDEELARITSAAALFCSGRVPVIAGAGSNSTLHAAALAESAEHAGADAVLCVTPYYNKTNQEGLARHFEAVAAATALPVILYNVPSRTGLSISPETYARLSETPNIVAVKEANGDFGLLASAMNLCKGRLTFYSGNDDMTEPAMAMGALGVISVLANVLPAETAALCSLCLERRFDEAAALQSALMPLINALFCDVNPIPVKSLMAALGVKVGPARPPLTELAPQKLKSALSDFFECQKRCNS